MTGGQSWHPPSHIFFEFLPVVPIIKSRKISKFYAITQTSLQVWSLSQNSQFQTFQVSRFCFVSPGLLVNKSKPPSYYKLVKSPGFFTFISRFFLLFTCFSALLLIFCIEKLELSHPLSVIGFESSFCLHPIRNSTVKLFPKWRRKMHTKIHRACMKNLYALYIYQDNGAMVQLVKDLLSAPFSLFWVKNSPFLMEPIRSNP